QVRRPGDTGLPERRLARAHTVDLRGEVVVERPADACADDQPAGEDPRPPLSAGEYDARDGDHAHPDPSTRAERLAEDERAEQRGGGPLGVQEQGHRASSRRPQSEQEQDRPDNAAEDDGASKAAAVDAIEWRAFAPLPQSGRGDADRRPGIEET